METGNFIFIKKIIPEPYTLMEKAGVSLGCVLQRRPGGAGLQAALILEGHVKFSPSIPVRVAEHTFGNS